MAKVVMVGWKDSHISALWEEKEAINSLTECISVGFLVRETDELVELCTNLGLVEDCAKFKSCCIVIPKSTITTWRELWQ